MIKDLLADLNNLSHKRAGYNLFKFEEGNLKAKFSAWDKTLWLQFIEVSEKDTGKGIGAKFMRLLTETADFRKVKIRIEAKSYKKYGPSTEILMEWYKGWGFKSCLMWYSDYIRGKLVRKVIKGMLRNPQ